jgi:hypothetical protein
VAVAWSLLSPTLMATSSGCSRIDEYRWFRISPRRIQAWREVDELPNRELMRDGRRLV